MDCPVQGNGLQTHGLRSLKCQLSRILKRRAKYCRCGREGRRLAPIHDHIPNFPYESRRPEPDVVLESAEQQWAVRYRCGVFRPKPIGVLEVDEDGGEEGLREVVERDGAEDFVVV